MIVLPSFKHEILAEISLEPFIWIQSNFILFTFLVPLDIAIHLLFLSMNPAQSGIMERKVSTILQLLVGLWQQKQDPLFSFTPYYWFHQEKHP